MSVEITNLLNELSELQAQRDLLELDRKAAVDSVLTPEIRQQLADIDAEFADKGQTVTEKIAEMEKEVRGCVIEHGETVKGEHLMAVYSLRTSWDTKRLEGYAAAHPEVLGLRKQSVSISIRKR
jgi:hypothetical protein